MALNSLFCVDVPLRNYSLTHAPPSTPGLVPVFTRDSSVLATAWVSVCLSVQQTVTLLYCVKSVQARIPKFSP